MINKGVIMNVELLIKSAHSQVKEHELSNLIRDLQIELERSEFKKDNNKLHWTRVESGYKFEIGVNVTILDLTQSNVYVKVRDISKKLNIRTEVSLYERSIKQFSFVNDEINDNIKSALISLKIEDINLPSSYDLDQIIQDLNKITSQYNVNWYFKYNDRFKGHMFDAIEEPTSEVTCANIIMDIDKDMSRLEGLYNVKFEWVSILKLKITDFNVND
jgi:uncharacterized FlaG/YvyC family protein